MPPTPESITLSTLQDPSEALPFGQNGASDRTAGTGGDRMAGDRMAGDRMAGDAVMPLLWSAMAWPPPAAKTAPRV